jgi:hypothetical protein
MKKSHRNNCFCGFFCFVPDVILTEIRFANFTCLISSVYADLFEFARANSYSISIHANTSLLVKTPTSSSGRYFFPGSIQNPVTNRKRLFPLKL